MRRPAWWREVLLVAVVYGLYTLTRNTLPAHEARARANALDLLRLEQRLHLDIEQGLNSAIAGHGTNPLSVVFGYVYSTSHFVVTLAVLLWLYVARPRSYGRARTALLVATVVSLLGFWLCPLAPPRFFPELGFVDTIVRDGTWGSWGSNAVTAISNQYAAMPSVHVAWSLWSAAVVIMLVRSRWLKVVAAAYPVLVFFVIVGTGNHWTLDAAGGLVAAGLGAAAALLLDRLRRRRSSSAGPTAQTWTATRARQPSP